jgi:hypothetical protein
MQQDLYCTFHNAADCQFPIRKKCDKFSYKTHFFIGIIEHDHSKIQDKKTSVKKEAKIAAIQSPSHLDKGTKKIVKKEALKVPMTMELQRSFKRSIQYIKGQSEATDGSFTHAAAFVPGEALTFCVRTDTTTDAAVNNLPTFKWENTDTGI